MNQLELSNQLSQIKHPSLFAEIVRENPVQAIPMIKDQIKDNRLALVEIIGERLVVVIEKL